MESLAPFVALLDTGSVVLALVVYIQILRVSSRIERMTAVYEERFKTIYTRINKLEEKIS